MIQGLPGFREVPQNYNVEDLITAFSQNDQELAKLRSADILLLPERFQFADGMFAGEYYPDSTDTFLQFLESEKETSNGILARASDDETFMRRSDEVWLAAIKVALPALIPKVVDLVRRYLLKQGKQQNDVVHLKMVVGDKQLEYDGLVKNLHTVVEETKHLWDK